MITDDCIAEVRLKIGYRSLMEALSLALIDRSIDTYVQYYSHIPILYS
jgi:hypothetical protein